MGQAAFRASFLMAMTMTPLLAGAADTVVETALFTSGERVRLEEGGEPFAFVIDLGGSFRSVERQTIEFFFVDDLLDAEEFVAIYLDGKGRGVRHYFATPQSRRSITSTLGNDFLEPLMDGVANARLEALDGSVIVSQIVISITGDFVPDGGKTARAEKTDQLVGDMDLDGRVDPGDVVEYQIRVFNAGTQELSNVVLTDDPHPISRLLNGTVTTTHGNVSTGNEFGDERVVVDIGTLATGSEEAIVGFQVQVPDDLPANVPALSNQAVLTGDDLPAQVSDDPRTSPPLDPTVTMLENEPIDRCERSLDDCESDRSGLLDQVLELEDHLTQALDELETSRIESAELRQQLAEAQSRLASVEADLAECLAPEDSDGDGLQDELDACPDSAVGTTVDTQGCSLSQFCAVISIQGPGALRCLTADWQDDEAGERFPEDCRPRGRWGCQAASAGR